MEGLGEQRTKGCAADLGITRETLRLWGRAAEGDARAATGGSGPAGSKDAEVTRLRTENARLLKAEKEWQLEREILRRAAQYFANAMK